jgi:hypothetical protein
LGSRIQFVVDRLPWRCAAAASRSSACAIDHEGLVHEHDCFAEALALRQDLDDFFAALRRGEGQLHLAIDDQVEAALGVALVEQDVATRRLGFRGCRGRCAQFPLSPTVEKRYVRQ